MKSRCIISRVTVGSVLLVLLLPLSARAATYYVAPTGSDSAAGTMASPFASWARAQTAAAAGDTVYFRGGTYKYTAATSACTSTSATVNAVVLSKSGTSGNTINYFAYPGETPVFDFSGITGANCRQSGVRVEADWLYLKGLEFTGTLQINNLNHESWCVYVYGGSNNKFELLNAHHNMGPGFFIQEGGNNTFLNCDSHENEDTLTSNGDGQSADGFGCHPDKAGDTGNVFHGCRAWWNSDDAWDFINSQEACTVEYSWAWYSGYKPDAVTNGAPVGLSAGNGNGFKAGGYGDPQTNVPATPPQHIVRFDAAFYVKSAGLYANHEIVSPYFYNNTLYNNSTQVNMLGLDGTTVTSVGILKNNLAYSNNGKTLTAQMNNGGPISDTFNSWDSSLNVKVTDADFQSVAFSPPSSCPAAFKAAGTVCCPPDSTTCFAGMASARQADGSPPVMPFLRLAANSALIDKGTNVGLPYVGKAPDLGAFEYGAATSTTGSGGTSGSTGAGGSSGAGGATGAGGSPGTGGGASGGSGGTGAGGASGDSGGTGSGGASVDSGQGGSGTGGSATGSGGPSTTGSGGSGSSATGGSSDSSGGCSCGMGGAEVGGGTCASLGILVLGLFGPRRSRRAGRGPSAV